MAATRLTGRHISIEDDMQSTNTRRDSIAALFPIGLLVVRKENRDRVGAVCSVVFDEDVGVWRYGVNFRRVLRTDARNLEPWTSSYAQVFEDQLDYAPEATAPESDIAFGERVATRIVSDPHIVKHDSPKLTAIGRDELITKINMLEASNNVLRGRLESELKERTEERDKARREAKTLSDQVTTLQERSNAHLAAERISRRLEGDPALLLIFTSIAQGIDRARRLHPEGCSLVDLMSEVGEACSAAIKEGADRFNEELVDVAVVTARLINGEYRSRDTHAARPR